MGVEHQQKSQKRAVVYRRVANSRAGISHTEMKLARQRAICNQIAEANGVEIVATYTDLSGGARLDRPMLQQLLRAVLATDIDYVIASDYAVLSRDYTQMAALETRLRRAGVKVLTSQKASAPTNALPVILSLFVELDHRARSETMKAVWARRRAAKSNGDTERRAV